MGRGRAKAKQTKVARRLKYHSPEMDLESLQRELAGQNPHHDEKADEYDEHEDDLYAKYADWAEEYDDEDEDNGYGR